VNVVFGGGWWPLGWHVGFVEAPFDSVVERFRAWMKDLHGRHRFDGLEGSIADQLHALAPLEAPWTRELFVRTTGPWTAHFSNSVLGGDSWPRVSFLAGELGVRWVTASHIPRGQYPYPSTQLWLGGPEGDQLGFVRTISAGIYDSGRWEFEANGPVQPWEEPEHYQARLKRDRFTRELLLRYLKRLAIDADDPSFYSDGVRVSERALWHWTRPPRTLSLAEARRDYARSSPRP
jgi:hypothetical protein